MHSELTTSRESQVILHTGSSQEDGWLVWVGLSVSTKVSHVASLVFHVEMMESGGSFKRWHLQQGN